MQRVTTLVATLAVALALPAAAGVDQVWDLTEMFPTEKDFRSCELCHRKACPSRHAPFNKALWDSMQHD